jgi:hypothetical protein
MLLDALNRLEATGVALPRHELYPDASSETSSTLGHAVRLPLGVHRVTGRRYPIFDAEGHPCAFTSTAAAMRFVLAGPLLLIPLRDAGAEMTAPTSGILSGPGWASSIGSTDPVGKAGTRSAVMRWVDAHVSPLDLLTGLVPDTELRRVGRGYLGWCPFHDDRGHDEQGRPDTPSFHVVEDRHYGWSRRCLSTNCVHHEGPMRHSFRLFQDLTGLTCSAAIREACA